MCLMPSVTEPGREGTGTPSPRPPQGLSRRQDSLALLAALCFFLAALEYLIPKPVPFLRLGLANLPILIALKSYPKPSVVLLILLKVFGQGLIQGTLFSYVFVFSFCGSAAGGVMMMAASRLPDRWMSLTGISILGALGSNLVQLAAAEFFLLGSGAWVIAPPFLGVGLVSSALLGTFAEGFSRRSRWLAGWGDPKPAPGVTEEGGAAVGSRGRSADRRASRFFRGNLSAPALIIAGAAVMPAFLFQPHGTLQLLMAALFLASAWLKGRRIRLGLVFSFLAGITAVHLFTPHGRVLWEAGSWAVTSGALQEGLRKGGLLIGMMYLSQFSVDSRLNLPGRAGAVLGRSFFYFEQLLEFRERITWRHLSRDLDRVLSELRGGGGSRDRPYSGSSSFFGILFLVLWTALFYGLWLLGFASR